MPANKSDAPPPQPLSPQARWMQQRARLLHDAHAWEYEAIAAEEARRASLRLPEPFRWLVTGGSLPDALAAAVLVIGGAWLIALASAVS